MCTFKKIKKLVQLVILAKKEKERKKERNPVKQWELNEPNLL